MQHGTSCALRRGGNLVPLTLLSLLLPLAGLGCAAEKSELKVTSITHGQDYDQKFTRAFAGCDKHGDTDIVLACDPCAVQGPSGPCLRQIMHIRVLWGPDQKLKIDGPATTNACIRWYVFTDAQKRDLIEYSGTGLVTVEPQDGLTKVTIRNATLNPTFNRGDLTDPIGTSHFDGSIIAQTNPGRVTELLSEIKTTLASAALDRSETAGNLMPRHAPQP